MSLWWCCFCGTRYAVGLIRCPHCGSNDHEENPVPHSTVHSGPSNGPYQAQPAESPVEPQTEPAATEHKAPKKAVRGPAAK